MNRLTKLCLLGVIPAVALLVAGCATMSNKTASAAKEKAVLCDKCEAAWVVKPQHIGKTTIYRREQKMVCDDCDAAVHVFLKTGKLAATCKACGGNLTVCAPHEETIQLAKTAAKEAQVFTCTKCKTVWVRHPQQLGKATVYRAQKKVVCPDCESAVMHFFKTGKFEHTCKACGDQLNQCTMCK
jgi:hypothetical protein